MTPTMECTCGATFDDDPYTRFEHQRHGIVTVVE